MKNIMTDDPQSIRTEACRALLHGALARQISDVYHAETLSADKKAAIEAGCLDAIRELPAPITETGWPIASEVVDAMWTIINDSPSRQKAINAILARPEPANMYDQNFLLESLVLLKVPQPLSFWRPHYDSLPVMALEGMAIHSFDTLESFLSDKQLQGKDIEALSHIMAYLIEEHGKQKVQSLLGTLASKSSFGSRIHKIAETYSLSIPTVSERGARG